MDPDKSDPLLCFLPTWFERAGLRLVSLPEINKTYQWFPIWRQESPRSYVRTLCTLQAPPSFLLSPTVQGKKHVNWFHQRAPETWFLQWNWANQQNLFQKKETEWRSYHDLWDSPWCVLFSDGVWLSTGRVAIYLQGGQVDYNALRQTHGHVILIRRHCVIQVLALRETTQTNVSTPGFRNDSRFLLRLACSKI